MLFTKFSNNNNNNNNNNNDNNNNNNNNEFNPESTKWLFACTLKAIKTNILVINKCNSN